MIQQYGASCQTFKSNGANLRLILAIVSSSIGLCTVNLHLMYLLVKQIGLLQLLVALQRFICISLDIP